MISDLTDPVLTKTSTANDVISEMVQVGKQESILKVEGITENKKEEEAPEEKTLSNEVTDNSTLKCAMAEQTIESPSKKGAPKRKARPPRQSMHSLSTKTSLIKKKDKYKKVKDKRKEKGKGNCLILFS